MTKLHSNHYDIFIALTVVALASVMVYVMTGSGMANTRNILTFPFWVAQVVIVLVGFLRLCVLVDPVLSPKLAQAWSKIFQAPLSFSQYVMVTGLAFAGIVSSFVFFDPDDQSDLWIFGTYVVIASISIYRLVWPNFHGIGWRSARKHLTTERATFVGFWLIIGFSLLEVWIDGVKVPSLYREFLFAAITIGAIHNWLTADLGAFIKGNSSDNERSRRAWKQLCWLYLPIAGKR